MENRKLVLKQWFLVTIGSFLLLILSFAMYYMLFMIFERVIRSGEHYAFVSYLRVGYGIFWLILCIGLYFSKIRDWLKACFLAMGMSTFLTAISVQLYEKAWISIVFPASIILLAAFLLFKFKMKWYHYYALGLVIIALIIYLWSEHKVI